MPGSSFELSLTLDPPWVRVPDSAVLTARTARSVSGSGHEIVIRDDTGCVVARAAAGTTCEYRVPTTWAMNELPPGLAFTAEVQSSEGMASDRAKAVLWVEEAFFDAALTFERLDAEHWEATASCRLPLDPTPYELRVERYREAVLATCDSGTRCSAAVAPGGIYRASVEQPGHRSFSRSAWWSLTEDGPREETLDDLCLVSLAERIGAPDDVCTLLGSYPGTQTGDEAESDQLRACRQAVDEGRGTIDVLRAVYAAAPNTTVLWHLMDETYG